MATYYDREYWARSEQERLSLAREDYLNWKRIVARSRARIAVPRTVKVVVEGGYRYVDVWGKVTDVPPTVVTLQESIGVRGIHRRQYLNDYKRYMMALLEYERLRAAADRHDSHIRPTSAANRPPRDTARGPEGITDSAGSSVPESDVLVKMRQKLLDKLHKSVKRAKRLKTDESIADVLDDVVEAQTAGYDEEADDALLEMAAVAGEILEESMEVAARVRTRDAVRNVLRDMANVQALPGDDQTEAAYQLAADIVEELDDKAEEWFRKKPTKQRFKFRLQRMTESQFLGRRDEHDWMQGAVRRKPGSEYTTKPGDTLSKIAREFYGDASRWDVLYVNNYGLVGDDPDSILPGVTLRIP